MSIKYIYLIQGKAELVKVFFELQNRPSSRAIFLTYDQELNGAIYFPNSTWSQGRNRLLDELKRWVLQSIISFLMTIFNS